MYVPPAAVGVWDLFRGRQQHLTTPTSRQTPYNLRAGLYVALQKWAHLVLVEILVEWKIDYQGGGVKERAWGNTPKGNKE